MCNKPFAKIEQRVKYEKIMEYSNTKFRRMIGMKRAIFDKMAEFLRKSISVEGERQS